MPSLCPKNTGLFSLGKSPRSKEDLLRPELADNSNAHAVALRGARPPCTGRVEVEAAAALASPIEGATCRPRRPVFGVDHLRPGLRVAALPWPHGLCRGRARLL